jgi:hypothetical protein
MTLGRIVDLMCYWNRHNAQYRRVFMDQRNVHGELTIAFDELFCSVKGIYKPEMIPVLSFSIRNILSLLA